MDFARSAHRPNRPSSTKKYHRLILTLFFFGLSLGGLLGGGMVWKAFQLQWIQCSSLKISTSKNASVTPSSVCASAEQPSFDFYSLLPMSHHGSSVSLHPPTEHPQYLLQLASFREKKMAEKFIAQLARFGYYARSDISKKDSIWVRVLLGPYKNYDKVLRDQRLLAKRNILGLIVTLKK